MVLNFDMHTSITVLFPFTYRNLEVYSEDVYHTNKNPSMLLNIGNPLSVTYCPSLCLPGSMSKFLLNKHSCRSTYTSRYLIIYYHYQER